MSYAPGDVLGERYVIVELIGAGGMGEVYRARDRVLERDVAIKVLHGHLAEDDDLLERFRREARVLARVRHPGIIAIYDMLPIGDGRQAIVLEYVPGHSLEQEIAEAGTLDWRRCAEIGTQVAGALAAAHAQEIVHRDIKPSNILLEPNGSVRVADFGIARLQDDRTVTRGGESLGTPAFMAPEQVHGHQATAQSDLYSLGAVLFLAATGRTPFQTDAGGFAAALVHVTQPVPDPAEVRPDIPPAAREAIMRALAKEPGDRFASAEDMGAVLRESAGIASLSLPQPTSTLPADESLGPETAGAGATRIVAHEASGGGPTPPPTEPTAATGPTGPAGGGDGGGGGKGRRRVLLGAGAGAVVILAVVAGLAVGGVFSGSDTDPGTTTEASDPDPGTTTDVQEPTTTAQQPTTEVVTVTEQATTEGPAPESPGGQVFRTAGFTTPSGNINCTEADLGLACSRANDGLNVFQPVGGPPDSFTDTEVSGGVTVPYGSDWEGTAFRCDSEFQGITCFPLAGGEGFFLSRDEYTPLPAP